MQNYSFLLKVLYKIKESPEGNAFLSCPPVYWVLRGAKTAYESLILNIKHQKPDGSASEAFFSQNEDRIEANCRALADEDSRLLYRQLIGFRRNPCFFATPRKYSCLDQYFPEDIVKLTNTESFIDCGAFFGDTVSEFSKRVNGCFISAVAFEPDADNYRILCKNTADDKRVIPLKFGLWSCETTLTFLSGYSDGCYLVDTGRNSGWNPEDRIVSVDVVSIDSIPACAGATFIKMDIEGSELEALKGAQKTIAANRPKLAISIYHSDKDIIDIIEYIRTAYPFYRLYVRQHSPSTVNETVLYAIPQSAADAL